MVPQLALVFYTPARVTRDIAALRVTMAGVCITFAGNAKKNQSKVWESPDAVTGASAARRPLILPTRCLTDV